MCRIIISIFSLLYVFALLILFAGAFEWFGAEQDPLSGVFLILIGQPWVRFVDVLPESLWPAGTALSPAITLIVLMTICKYVRKRAI